MHRRSLEPDEITTLDGLPITTPARTTIDLAAAGLRGRKLEAALDAAVEHELDFSDLHRLLDRHRGRAGVPAVSALLERYTPGTVDTRSVLEDIVLDLCDAHGIPRPLATRSSPGAGATSSGRTRRSSSRPTRTAGTARPAASPPTARRDVELTLAGIPFLRFSYEQITDEPGDVAAATLRRAHSPRASRAATSAFRRSQTSVIGPTPPGTGETASTSGSTDSVSTSPTSCVEPSGPRHRVDADVDHDRALADEPARDQPGHARGDDEQVGHPRVLREPARVRGVLVRRDDGRVAGEAEDRRRLADVRRPADDDEVEPVVGERRVAARPRPCSGRASRTRPRRSRA